MQTTNMQLSDPFTNSSNQDFIDLFHHQLEKNENYANYVHTLGVDINSVSCWDAIPALPTDAFKSAHNPSCLSQDLRNTTFYTSGTTTETKGAHYFPDTALYEQSILVGWRHCQLPELHTNTFILTPSNSDSPHSSLSHMFHVLKQELCPTAEFIMSGQQLDVSKVITASVTGKPITLLGTALAFLQMFESLDAPIILPEGSWVLETGGYKGTEKSLTKKELYQLFDQKLGVSEDEIWNEYSMTELSSQFYTSGIGAPHIGPPSTRIKVIHPETGETVNPREMGYLVIYDLANAESCLAIRTQDLAIYHDAQSFTLIGRDPSALPRGCSRSLSKPLSSMVEAGSSILVQSLLRKAIRERPI